MDEIINKRPKFNTPSLEKFSKDMENIEWDNEEGQGTLKAQEIKAISEAILKVSKDKKSDLTQDELDIIEKMYDSK